MSNKYGSYITSNIQWLQEYPSHWNSLKLKYLCNIDTGSKDTQDKESEGRYPFFVRSPKVEKLNEYTHDEEAVMTAGDGVGVGKVFHYFKGKFAVHQRVYIFTKFKKVSGKFIYYYLKANLAFEVLSGNAKSTVDSLRRPMLADFTVTVPTLVEQNKVVQFLDLKTIHIDKIINQKEQLIKLLEEKRQAIITEAVTKGLNPDAKMKDSGVEWIGEIPEHWTISKIKYQAFINNHTLNENTAEHLEIDYIDIGSVNSKGEIDQIEKYVFSEAPSRARRILLKGDTIISTVRTYLKAITSIEEERENLICSTGFAVLTPKKSINEKFLSYLFKTTNYIDEIVSRSTGVSYPAINATEIGNFECILPSFDEQEDIVFYLNRCLKESDEVTMKINMQIQKLKEYRQSLIYEAVTGKIDVRDIDIEE